MQCDNVNYLFAASGVTQRRPASDPPAATPRDGIVAMRKRLEIFFWDRIGPAPDGTYLPYAEIIDAFKQSGGCIDATPLETKMLYTFMKMNMPRIHDCSGGKDRGGFNRLRLLSPSELPCSWHTWLPEHKTRIGYANNHLPGGTPLQTTVISGDFKFMSGDTEERALETVECLCSSLKEWVGDIYHPERAAKKQKTAVLPPSCA